MPRIVDLSNVVSAVAIFGVFAAVYFAISTLISYPKLRHVPGPALAAFSELWLFNATSKGNVYLSAEDVLRKYGRRSSNTQNI
jgi:hypothetical protein